MFKYFIYNAIIFHINMNAWLIRNTYLNTSKYNNLVDILKASFKEKDVNLIVKTADQIGIEIDTIKNVELPEFVIFWDKDYYLARKLEILGLKLFNSADSILFCDNKILMYQELARNGIRIPKTFVIPKTYEKIGYLDFSYLDDVINEIGFPFVVKEAYGSFGAQVYLANNVEEAKEIIKNIWWKPFVIQEFIESSKGRDIRINVVNDKAIVSMLRENKDDFRSNITNGGVGSMFEPEQAYIDLAIKASKVLKCDFSGVDVMFGPDGEPIICEVNSNPQFASTLRATGINLADYIRDYILEALKWNGL